MYIEFMFNNIKNISLIYSIKEMFNEDFGSQVTEVTYLGTQYSESVISQLLVGLNEIKRQSYKGQTDRIAHEEYEIETQTSQYTICFTVDTFNDKKQTQLSISIFTEPKEEYDIFLEKLKIQIKEILLRDWKICTWIIDEQSENLGMKLYPLIFKAENKMRAFINKVLTYKFGVNWIDLIGFEDIVKSYQKSMVEFKREVPQFSNINDILIATTAESLAKLMFKLKIYEPKLDLSDTENLKIHKMISEGNSNSVFDVMLKARKVKVDLWNDVFKKYFTGNDIEKAIADFIKNRNHVAHNKLSTKASFEKMRQNIISTETLFDKANIIFINEEPSDELYETWDAKQQELQNEKEYIYDKIRSETGIDIRFSDGILVLFGDMIHELFATIDDEEYFNYSVNISSLSNIEDSSDKLVLFSVKSNVDSSFNFDVCSSFDINEGMDEDSYMYLWIEKADHTKLIETTIMYHNGEAHEDSMECYYVPDGESFVESEHFKSFMEELQHYIKYEMNTIKVQADMISNMSVKDGGDSPVADFPCWNCYQNYVCLDDKLYPYGHCINCGEENEIKQCIRCSAIYPADEGGDNLCNNCLEKIKDK